MARSPPVWWVIGVAKTVTGRFLEEERDGLLPGREAMCMFAITGFSLNLCGPGNEIRDLGLDSTIKLVNVDRDSLQLLVARKSLDIGKGKLSNTC